MRLTNFEATTIKKVFTEIFGEGKIYLFGSRIDDSKRGGDIDLYLCPKNEFEDIREKKIEFLIRLDECKASKK